jgi:hypothetical protein
VTVACEAVARLGSARSVRRWMRQGEVDAGERDGVTTRELEEIKKAQGREQAATRGCGDPEGGHRRGNRPSTMLVGGDPISVQWTYGAPEWRRNRLLERESQTYGTKLDEFDRVKDDQSHLLGSRSFLVALRC